MYLPANFPCYLLTDVVLMPGSTLPMILSEPEEISVLNMALHEPLPTTRLIVVVRRYERHGSPNLTNLIEPCCAPDFKHDAGSSS